MDEDVVMKFVVLNQHTNNFGDDAAGCAMLSQIVDTFPASSVTVYYLWNEEKNRLPFIDTRVQHCEDVVVSKKNIRVILWDVMAALCFGKRLSHPALKAIETALATADWVVIAPGGANIGIYKDWLFLAVVLLAVHLRKPVVFHLNTIGKSNSAIFNQLAKYALKRSSVFVREQKSHATLSQWGISSYLGVDTAFSLPERVSSGAVKDLRYVVFIPTELANWHVDFRNESGIVDVPKNVILPELVEFCAKHKYTLVLLPHLSGSYSETAFLKKLCQHAKQIAPDVNVYVEEQATTWEVYEKYIAHAFAVVSMRYHGVVLAAKNKVPFVSLSYENKMREAAMYASMPEFDVYIKDIKQGFLTAKLDVIQASRDDLVARLANQNHNLLALSKLPLLYIWLRSKQVDSRVKD